MLAACLVIRCQAGHAFITWLHTNITAKVNSLLSRHHPLLLREESLVVLSRYRVVLVSALSSSALAIIRHEVRVEGADVVVSAPIVSLSLCLHLIPTSTVLATAVESRRLYTGELRLVRTTSSLHMLWLLLLVHHLLLLQLVRHHGLMRMLMLMLLHNSKMNNTNATNLKSFNFPFWLFKKEM